MVSNTLGLESTQDTVPHFIHSFVPPKQVESFCLLKNVALFLRPSAKHAASQTPFCFSFASCFYEHHSGNTSSFWRWQAIPATATEYMLQFSMPLEPDLFCPLKTSIRVGQCSLLRSLDPAPWGPLILETPAAAQQHSLLKNLNLSSAGFSGKFLCFSHFSFFHLLW